MKSSSASQAGFTLIELMVVVAVIAILAAIAMPQYQNYVTKVRWQEAVISLDSTRAATVECALTRGGDLTSCDTDADINMTMPLSAAGGRVTVSRGAFTNGAGGAGGQMQFILASSDPTMGGCTVTITGTMQSNIVAWNLVTSGAGCTKANTGY